MLGKSLWRVTSLLALAALVLAACGGGATEAPPAATEAPVGHRSPGRHRSAGRWIPSQIPDIAAGKFNVVMVRSASHNDGGWSQAHTEGTLWMATRIRRSPCQYLETVPPGPDAEAGHALAGPQGLRPDHRHDL